MKLIISLMLLTNLVYAQSLYFRKGGGDDAGNGGFAYKQSIKILKLATQNLQSKISSVDIEEFKTHPEWRVLLQNVLRYENLDKSWWKTKIRNGQPLSMDYRVRNPKVIILKLYYQTFMGKTDTEIPDAVIDVEKRLLHEASHIWGYDENESEEFAERFLTYANNEATRASGDILIKSNFCSCLNGKSDILSDCDAFCDSQKITQKPTLYLETILGEKTLKNPKIKNMYDWCNKQLDGDVTLPQCYLTAYDGYDLIENIPVTIKKDSNKLTADLSLLKLNTTYILKIVEGKTGSNAETQEIQLRRIKRDENKPEKSLINVMSITQFTCLTYYGRIEQNGNTTRNGFVRNYFFLPENEIASPIPSSPDQLSFFVCHDETIYGRDDNVLYPRLETINNKITLFDKKDSKFISLDNNYKINKIIQKRLQDEYNISTNVNLISPINFEKASHLSTSYSFGGYFVLPFIDMNTNLGFCPTNKEYNSSTPLFNIMKDYFQELEAFYIAESEPQTVFEGGIYRTYYSNQFVRQSDLMKYGFYLKNGLKEKADESDFHTQVIYFYYPISSSIDPLVQGDRKLFTIKYPDELNNTHTLPTNHHISDKRIGCIPK